jgi:photosystem II stability/assembly factor-like uncharacterized protein
MNKRFLVAAGGLVCALIASVASAISQSSLEVEAGRYDESLYSAMSWRTIGPYRGGRVTTVAGVASQPFTFYFGASGGGVWKTTDAGQSWVNVSDGYFKAGSIGAIAVAPSAPDIVYVGTGSAAPRGNVSPGVGVYKSADAGESWEHIGLPRAGQIDRIEIHPENPDLVYVAVLGQIFGSNEERGVYRSKDGGGTWEKVLYISTTTGIIDLDMDANDPRVLYAASWRAERKPWDFIGGPNEGGIFKTTDGGDTWTQLTEGLPEGVVGKLAVTVSPANPNRLWAVVEADAGGLYRSDDAGQSWRLVNPSRRLRARAWYYTNVYADPKDENTVYYLGEDVFKSTDGGETLEEVPVPHVDNHDLWINPDEPKIMIEANDGGATVTFNGGETWTTQMNQPTAEIYRVTVDNDFPYRVYGAQQDNSTLRIPSRTAGPGITLQHWEAVGGGESGHIAVDLDDPDIVYAGTHGQISRIDLETGLEREIHLYPENHIGVAARDMRYRFQWNAPIRISPHDSSVVYHCSQHVHKTTDGGQTWETISPDLTKNDPEKQEAAGGPVSKDGTTVEFYNTIFAFEESPHTAGTLWVGTDDGLVHLSRDAGKNWKDITPERMPGEGSTVNTIELSSHEPGRAFIAVHRYRMNDFKPYLFRTDDSGESWELLTDGTNGIPSDHFTRVVREDPDRKGLLYAGTEFGLFVSFDDGAQWQPFQLDLPVTPVTDLVVHEKDLVAATQGRGFWILDDLTPLHQIDATVAAADAHLYEPRPAYRTRGSQAGPDERILRSPLKGGWTPAYMAGQNPPAGAIIYYYFAAQPEGEVRLEILDAEGEVARTFSSRGPEDEEMEKGDDDEEKGNGRLPAEAGMNRFAWDLRYEGVDVTDDTFVWGYTGGPTAVPGTYQVRMTAGDWTETRSVEVKKDPRLNISNADYRAQFDLMMQIRAKLVEMQTAIREIRDVRAKAPDDPRNEELASIEEELMQLQNEYRMDPLNFPPKLMGQTAYLYREVHSADGRPTAGAYERFEDLKEEIAKPMSRANELLGTTGSQSP